jgi:hypothetical protein
MQEHQSKCSRTVLTRDKRLTAGVILAGDSHSIDNISPTSLFTNSSDCALFSNGGCPCAKDRVKRNSGPGPCSSASAKIADAYGCQDVTKWCNNLGCCDYPGVCCADGKWSYCRHDSWTKFWCSTIPCLASEVQKDNITVDLIYLCTA